MSHQLDSLFTGNFLIDAGYATSLIPSLYKALKADANIIGGERLDKLENASHNKIETDGDSGTSNARSVLVISIKQPILKFTDEYMGWLGTKYYMRLMDAYKNDSSIAGIVLDIDSGGGQVYGTAEFYDYIREYPKPVVTYTDGYLCSAAYYMGNASKYIVANKRADAIGSIGAYANFLDFTGLWEKLGAKSHTIYATKSTRKNFESRQVNKDNYKPYIQNVLDPIVEIFHADMKATRPGLNEEVFTGDTWTGTEALEMGLVDELGTIDTAILKVLELDELQSNNQNNNTMSTTPRANLQGVLGLDAPLVETAEKGTYLNAPQLDNIEAGLTEKDGTIATLTANLATANTAKTEAETALANANTAHATAVTTTETAVKTMLTDAGLEATGNLQENLTALAAHQAVLNKLDGAPGAKVIVGADDAEKAGTTIVSGVDVSAALGNC